MMEALRNAQHAPPPQVTLRTMVSLTTTAAPAVHICTSTALLDEIIITDRYEYLKSKADTYRDLGWGGLRTATPELFSA